MWERGFSTFKWMETVLMGHFWLKPPKKVAELQGIGIRLGRIPVRENRDTLKIIIIIAKK